MSHWIPDQVRDDGVGRSSLFVSPVPSVGAATSSFRRTPESSREAAAYRPGSRIKSGMTGWSKPQRSESNPHLSHKENSNA